MVQSQTPIKVEISHKTVVFTVAFLLGIWLIVEIKEILIVIFLSIILVSAFLKPVEWLSKKGIPRAISVILVYILFLALLSTAIGVLVPPLIEQSKNFSDNLPQIITTINNFFAFHDIPVEDISTIIARQVQQIAGDIVRVTTKVFSSILLVLTTIVLSFYFLLEWDKFVRLFASPFSGKQEKKVINLATKIEAGLGHWLRGQITLSIIVGVLVFIGLTLLGIPYAIPLAVIAALLEIIPVIGPTISALPAILVGLTISPLVGLAVAALYIVIQQVEGNLIVPIIMSRAVGLNPPIVILAFLVGSKIAGVGGAILAIPFIVLVRIVVSELFVEEKIENPVPEE